MSSILPTTAATASTLTLEARSSVWGTLVSRLADYVTLSKPRIAVMVLVVVSVGYAVGCEGAFDVEALLSALLGIGSIATGCGVLNQWLEKDTDAQMRRTAQRPLPAGRVTATETLLYGTGLAVFGAAWLFVSVNALTALLTLATLVAYVGIYTPLKRWTSLCTTIGAIPGAMPPVLGWTAAGRELDAGALALFGILFLWQFPHFFAIAWIYREDYEGAGLRMLPRRRDSRLVGGLAVAYALVLIPVSLVPRQLGLAGDAYFWIALALGGVYLLASVRFLEYESRSTARRLLLTSLIYLPALLAGLTIDHWRLLR